jgi:uncharacterized protein DUF1616
VGSATTSPPLTPPLPIRTSGLLVLAVLTALYCVAIVFGGILWLTLPLGLLTLFFTPGYGLVAIGVGERRRWPWYLTTVLVVGLSVGFNIALGLLLLVGHYGLLPLLLGISALVLLFLGAVAQFSRSGEATDRAFATMVRAELGLRGYSPAQRGAAYALVVAILIVIAGMAYIASVNPREKSDVSFGITGPQGTIVGLPIALNVKVAATFVVNVGNNGTAQAWTLFISANATAAEANGKPLNVTPPVPQFVAWNSPLVLANGNFSNTSLGVLAPNEVLTLNVSLQFNTTLSGTVGSTTNYTVTFELLPAGGNVPVREASWFFFIKVPVPAQSLPSAAGRAWD